jgi:hypothetical protein
VHQVGFNFNFNSSLLTITLHSSVITKLVYNDTKIQSASWRYNRVRLYFDSYKNIYKQFWFLWALNWQTTIRQAEECSVQKKFGNANSSHVDRKNDYVHPVTSESLLHVYKWCYDQSQLRPILPQNRHSSSEGHTCRPTEVTTTKSYTSLNTLKLCWMIDGGIWEDFINFTGTVYAKTAERRRMNCSSHFLSTVILPPLFPLLVYNDQLKALVSGQGYQYQYACKQIGGEDGML